MDLVWLNSHPISEMFRQDSEVSQEVVLELFNYSFEFQVCNTCEPYNLDTRSNQAANSHRLQN